MKKHNNQTNGFLYVLSHPSNRNLLKIGVTRRSPEIRLKKHNTQFDKEAGKIVRETGQLWEISEVIDVDDVYLAEHEFWKRPPLTELPYSFTNELLFLSEGTDLDQRWVQEGLKRRALEKIRCIHQFTNQLQNEAPNGLRLISKALAFPLLKELVMA